MTEPTKDESFNGWDAASLAAYRRERDKATDLVAGNVVTQFKRGKAPVQILGPNNGYNPFTLKHSR